MNSNAEIFVQSHAVSSSSKSSCMSTWRRIRFRYPHALLPICASSPRAMKATTSRIASPGKLGSRDLAASSAYPNAIAQNMVQNLCAWTHRGSMLTSSMISQKSGCRLWSMADSAVHSRVLRDRTALDRYLSSGTANFTDYISPRISSDPTPPVTCALRSHSIVKEPKSL